MKDPREAAIEAAEQKAIKLNNNLLADGKPIIEALLTTHDYKNAYKDGFLAGWKEREQQTPWRKTNEGQPEDNEIVLFKPFYGDIRYGRYGAQEGRFYRANTEQRWFMEEIEYWMPIPPIALPETDKT